MRGHRRVAPAIHRRRKVAVRDGPVGPDAARRVERRDGIVQAAHNFVGGAEIVVRFGEIRSAVDRVTVGRYRVRKAPRCGERHPQMEVDERPIAERPLCFAKLSDGFLGAACFDQRSAELAPGVPVGGVRANGVAEVRDARFGRAIEFRYDFCRHFSGRMRPRDYAQVILRQS